MTLTPQDVKVRPPAESILAGALPPDLSIRRLTRQEYQRMRSVGILAEDNTTELVAGLLITKMTKNRAHSRANKRVRTWFEDAVPEGYSVDAQEPIVTEDSEPEPDVFILRGSDDDFLEEQPPARAVALVVEIADATLRVDRTLKANVYARAAVPVYWVVNLVERQIEVYTHPTLDAYAQRDIYGESDVIPLQLDGLVVARTPVSNLLP
ncbi:MAG: Uma2 family endonuclease [Anaerolineae bacterium]|nr:Uma2 family endonuclease [Anaerolineae bacterium]